MSDCWLLKKKKEKEATPNAFVSSKSKWLSIHNRPESGISLDKYAIIREEFNPFVSEGFVSLEDSSSQVPIKRHWGYSVLALRNCIAIECQHFY